MSIALHKAHEGLKSRCSSYCKILSSGLDQSTVCNTCWRLQSSSSFCTRRILVSLQGFLTDPALKFILFWGYSMKNGYDYINFLSLSLLKMLLLTRFFHGADKFCLWRWGWIFYVVSRVNKATDYRMLCKLFTGFRMFGYVLNVWLCLVSMLLITLVTNGTHFLLKDQGAKFEDNRLFTCFVPSVMTDQAIIHCMMCITLLTVMLVFFRAMS